MAPKLSDEVLSLLGHSSQPLSLPHSSPRSFPRPFPLSAIHLSPFFVLSSLFRPSSLSLDFFLPHSLPFSVPIMQYGKWTIQTLYNTFNSTSQCTQSALKLPLIHPFTHTHGNGAAMLAYPSVATWGSVTCSTLQHMARRSRHHTTNLANRG